MTDKTPVPSVQFDPAKHVIAGRKISDGRQRFFSLSSIVAAEKAIETPPAADPVIAAPPVTQADVEAIEAKVLAAVKASVPPPQFPADLMATFAELTASVVALKAANDALAARVAKLESDNAIWAKNFAGFMNVARSTA